MISVFLFSLLFWCESFLKSSLNLLRDFPGGSVLKNPPANARDLGSIPGSGRSPGEGNGNPLQYSCLGNPMDRGTCWAIPLGSKRIWPSLAAKQQLNLLQCCFCFMFWCFGHEAYGILASWDWTCTPCLGRWSLNHWTGSKVPVSLFNAPSGQSSWIWPVTVRRCCPLPVRVASRACQ